MSGTPLEIKICNEFVDTFIYSGNMYTDVKQSGLIVSGT